MLTDRLTDVEGVRVGQWTDSTAKTGCTVIVVPPGTIASGEVRGGAPGTREFDLLDPTRMVETIDAVLLCGGSAFGLAAADGVVRWCEENERGHLTAHGRVPIVVGAVIYDLGVGSSTVRPGPTEGYQAATDAATDSHDVGLVGAGTGATVNKLSGSPRPGGLGSATVASGDVIVSALMVVNSLGDVVDGPLTDASLRDLVPELQARLASLPQRTNREGAVRTNTTIGVLATNATLSKLECFLLAQSGHDGIARAIWPAHLSGDGDALIVLSVPSNDRPIHAPIDAIRALSVEAVARAIRAACGATVAIAP